MTTNITEQPNTLSKINTIFMDQNTLFSTTPETIPMATSVKSMDINEKKWNLKDIMEKPVLTGIGTWSSTQPSGSHIQIGKTPTLTSLSLPYQPLISNANSMQLNLIKSFTYARFNLQIIIQLNSTKFFAGRLMLYYIPMATPLSVEELSPTRASQLPNIEIDAGNSNPVILNVPWFYPFSSFNQSNGESQNWSMGTARLLVVSPLRGVGDATSVSYTIWTSYINTDLHISINPKLTWMKPTDDEDTDSLISHLSLFDRRIPNEGEMASLLLDAALPIVEQAASTVVAKGVGHLKKQTGGLLSNLFDRPRDDNYMTALNPILSSLANGAGRDSSKVLSLNPMDIYEPDPNEIRNDLSEMDLNIILRNPSILNIVQWKTADAPSTLIYSIPLHPMVRFTDVTRLRAFADRFFYYRGSLELTISVVATHFHSGRLIVSYLNGSPFSNTDMDSAMNSPIAVIDLSNTETREWTISLPYNSNVPWLYNVSALDDTSMNLVYLPRAYMGNLAVWVLNTLQAPETVSSTIDVIVRIAAGPDFEVAQPRAGIVRLNSSNFYYVGNDSDQQYLRVVNPPANDAQMADEEDAIPEPTPVVAVQHGGVSDRQDVCNQIMAKTFDLREVIRRFCLCTNIVIVPKSRIGFMWPVRPRFDDFDSSLLSHYSELYAGWSGTIRYKIIFNTDMLDSSTVRIIYRPDLYIDEPKTISTDASNTYREGPGWPVETTHVVSERSISFEVPYASNCHWLVGSSMLTQQDDSQFMRCNGTIIMFVDSGPPAETTHKTVNAISSQMYVAAGEDFKFYFPLPFTSGDQDIYWRPQAI